MKKKSSIIKLVIIGLVFLLGGYTVLFGLGGYGSAKNIILGLDVRGGVSITYEVADETFSQEDFNDTKRKLEDRANALSTEAEVYVEGDRRIVVNIPGETDAEVDATLAFVRDLALARVHVFPYSRREGTVAAAMEGQVDEAVKHARARKLIELGNQLERRFVSGLTGTCQQVLFEQPAGEGLSEGYTGQYVRVRAPARPGEICRVRIDGAEGTLALGTVVKREEEDESNE